MRLFPFVAAFATYCFVWSYGIQKRRWWAWYLGWVFGALTAANIVLLAVAGLWFTPPGTQRLINAMTPIGATCIWIFWARWWYTNRGEFFRAGKSRSNRERH